MRSLPGEVDGDRPVRVRAEWHPCGRSWLVRPQGEHVVRGRHAHTDEVEEAHRVGEGRLRAAQRQPVAQRRDRPGEPLGVAGADALGVADGDLLAAAVGEPDGAGVVDLAFGAALVHPVPVNSDHVHADIRPVPQDCLHTRQVAQRERAVEQDDDVLGEADVAGAPAFGEPDGDQIPEFGDAARPGLLGVADPAGHGVRLAGGDVWQPGGPRQMTPAAGRDQDDPEVVGAAEHAELDQQPPGQVIGRSGRAGDTEHTRGAQVDSQRYAVQGGLGETGPPLAAQVDRRGFARDAHSQPQTVGGVGVTWPYPAVGSGRGKREVEPVGRLHAADLLLGSHKSRGRVQRGRFLGLEAPIVGSSLSAGHHLGAYDAGGTKQAHHQDDGVTHDREEDRADHDR